MATSWQVHSSLTATGIISPFLIVDLGLFLSLVYFVLNAAIPLVVLYRKAKKLDELPGPAKSHWLLGHLKQFPPNEKGLLAFVKTMPQHHPTMFNRWNTPFSSSLHLYHPDTAVSFIKSGAPKSNIAYRFIRPWVGDGLLTSKGRKWHRNRHLLTPCFHFSILKGYARIFNECSLVMLKKWEASTGKAIEILPDISLMTLDTMLKCSMSTQTNCQDTREKHPYIQAIQNLAHVITHRINHPHLLPDLVFWNTKYGRRFQEAADIVHKQAEKIIVERRHQLEKAESKRFPDDVQVNDISSRRKKQQDFLDILLQTRDEDGNGLSEREIRDEVDTFLFAGHDTISSGISWAFYNLSKYPHFQEKCRKEVMDTLGEKAFVEWDDISKLVYLTMFLKESLRLYPPAPLVSRNLENELTLNSKLHSKKDLVVPKGTHVVLNIFTMHRHELLWKDPQKFDPERFTKDNIAKRPPHTYLPFSGGSRNCIGQNFALNEIKTVLAQTLRRYRLYLDDETLAPEMELKLTLRSNNGIHIKLERL